MPLVWQDGSQGVGKGASRQRIPHRPTLVGYVVKELAGTDASRHVPARTVAPMGAAPRRARVRAATWKSEVFSRARLPGNPTVLVFHPRRRPLTSGAATRLSLDLFGAERIAGMVQLCAGHGGFNAGRGLAV